MEAKEKAYDLFKKVYEELGLNSDATPQVKRICLLMVDEIIKEYKEEICEIGYDYDVPLWEIRKRYWQLVKDEIDRL